MGVHTRIALQTAPESSLRMWISLRTQHPADGRLKMYEFSTTTDTVRYLPGVVGNSPVENGSAVLASSHDGTAFLFTRAIHWR